MLINNATFKNKNIFMVILYLGTFLVLLLMLASCTSNKKREELGNLVIVGDNQLSYMVEDNIDEATILGNYKLLEEKEEGTREITDPLFSLGGYGSAENFSKPGIYFLTVTAKYNDEVITKKITLTIKNNLGGIN